ncbi:pleckstrin homology domain-containing family F member 2-like [Cyprinodon tularosa]|uniref:pleckstrin homology domain-containing family F member 2-like n=1 Tax=Cyprinodon tularosa TaxID=77115 RepID=UPI0018E20950|nr:pleckstrin homology domain-containing family F member 2-like [Cyprinodon tularosa]
MIPQESYIIHTKITVNAQTTQLHTNRHNIDIMDILTSETQNRKRIKEVETSFNLSGQRLSLPNRFLVGEGTLMKQGRKKWQQKAFFLFNDILMYGSVIINNRYKNQKIIPLRDLRLENMEDGEDFKNLWLICTPRKSFFISAPTYEEKRAWMTHIELCQSSLLQEQVPEQNLTFAKCWIPDQAAQKCMRCFVTFTPIIRRHHCRKCGFVVCNKCSKDRARINHIDPKKLLRVCKICSKICKENETYRAKSDSSGWRDDEDGRSSDDE